MIPILYAPDESNFNHGGIGALFETTSCVVEEERNGAFEIEFKYPVDGHLYKYIEEGCLVKAKPNDTAEPQLFSIYRSTKPINGIVTFYGEHISYELSGNPVENVEIENATAQDAMAKVFAAALLTHNYTPYSDITTPNSTSIARASVRGALGGVAGSLLSVWGGEYEFDNFTVKLHSSRGTNTGIKIAYGKNLTDLQQEKNISEVYVGVYPYAKFTPQAAENATEQPEEVVVSLSEKIIWSPHAAAHARKRVCIKNFSDRFNGANEITEEQLRKVVEAWVKTSGFDVPAVNITVSFVHLWHSPEYAQYALLERVNLCDTVSVEFSKLGVSATAKVIKTRYDVLNEKYLSITLGSAKANFADTVNQTSAAIEQTKQEVKQSAATLSADIKKAVDEAMQAITGQSGGYVVLNPPKNPQEILIMDAPTIAAAKNIWRWNSGGFGHSKNGYNGSFGTAITQDGAIVADFITAGTLRAIEIAACTIKGGSLNINDKFIVTTEGDATVAGKVTATSGTIGGCEIVDGVLKIKNANISEKLTAGSIDVSGVIKAGGIAILGDVEAEAKRATDAEGALSTRITANADGIAAEVERATAYEGTLSSRITANAEAITAKVSSSGGSDASFSWSLTSSGFCLKSNNTEVMSVTASGAVFSGTVQGASIIGGTIEIDDVITVKENGTVKIKSSAGSGNGILNIDNYWIELQSGSTELTMTSTHLEIRDNSYVGSLGRNVASHAALWCDGKLQLYRDGTYFTIYINGSAKAVCPHDLYITGNWTGSSAGSISSDRNKKNSISIIDDRYEVLFDNLSPCLFKYNDGTSDRLHSGFIAQEVDEALTAAGLTTKDFAAVCIADQGKETESWGLRYEEFVALNTREIQKLKARVAELEKQLST